MADSLNSSNPLEDLGRMVFQPLRFSTDLSQASFKDEHDFLFNKALLGALFVVSLSYLARMPSSLEFSLSFVDLLFEGLLPVFDAFRFDHDSIHQVRSWSALGVQTTFLVLFVGYILKAFAGLFVLSGCIYLYKKNIPFKQVFCLVAYAHWFMILGLFFDSFTGFFITTGLVIAYLCRLLAEAEGNTFGFKLFLKTYIPISIFMGLNSLLGLSLI